MNDNGNCNVTDDHLIETIRRFLLQRCNYLVKSFGADEGTNEKLKVKVSNVMFSIMPGLIQTRFSKMVHQLNKMLSVRVSEPQSK